MTAPLRVVCSWCLSEITPGPRGRPVSHGICPSCEALFYQEHKVPPIEAPCIDVTIVRAPDASGLVEDVGLEPAKTDGAK